MRNTAKGGILGAATAMLFAGLPFASAGAQAIGQEEEHALGKLSVSHDWDGPPACSPHSGGDGRSFAPSSGWAIITQRTADHSMNNGHSAIQRVRGGPAFPSVFSINSQFDTLLKLARVSGNDAAIREITQIRDSWINARTNVVNDNQVNYSVWAGAHGNCFDRKRGWADADFYVTIRYVGDDTALARTISDLNNKYFSKL